MGSIFAALAIVLTVIGSVAAWVTHIVVCIGALSGAKAMVAVVMLGIGIFVPPVGAIHGIMVWFGAGLF